MIWDFLADFWLPLMISALTLLAAVVTARSTIHVVTPYFLPDRDLIAALGVAAMQGVRMHIVRREKNNLKLVGWATTALLWQLLSPGCRVCYTPPPGCCSPICRPGFSGQIVVPGRGNRVE